MAKVLILRGLSGSGKSHYVAEFCLENPDLKIDVVSADFYFYYNGDYVFNPRLLGEAHAFCWRNFVRLISDNDFDVVIVDNTNSTWEREIKKYWDLATSCGHEVQVVWIKADKEVCKARNTHNVPPETIDKMAERFEIPLPSYVNQIVVEV